MNWLKTLWNRIRLEVKYRRKLRELRKEYMELEADIIEKEKIWSILKR